MDSKNIFRAAREYSDAHKEFFKSLEVNFFSCIPVDANKMDDLLRVYHILERDSQGSGEAAFSGIVWWAA